MVTIDSVCDTLRGIRKGGMQSSLATYMRSEVLRKMDLFKGCEEAFVGRVIENVDTVFFTPGDTIIQEGDTATSCYIINRGEVAVEVGGHQVAKLGDGSIFGEICLLGIVQHRTASIVALSVCDCRVVHRKDFQLAVRLFPKERERFRLEAERRLAEINKTKGVDGDAQDKKQGRQGRRFSAKRVAPILTKLELQGYDLSENVIAPRRRSSNVTPRRRSLGWDGLGFGNESPTNAEAPNETPTSTPKLPIIKHSRRKSTGTDVPESPSDQERKSWPDKVSTAVQESFPISRCPNLGPECDLARELKSGSLAPTSPGRASSLFPKQNAGRRRSREPAGATSANTSSEFPTTSRTEALESFLAVKDIWYVAREIIEDDDCDDSENKSSRILLPVGSQVEVPRELSGDDEEGPTM